jgi:hypothetical protein
MELPIKEYLNGVVHNDYPLNERTKSYLDAYETADLTSGLNLLERWREAWPHPLDRQADQDELTSESDDAIKAYRAELDDLSAAAYERFEPLIDWIERIVEKRENER